MTLNVLTSGFVFGSLYVLVACSMNAMYAPTHVFNFAQGDLIMVSAMVAAVLTETVHLTWFLALLLCMAAAGLIALIEERVAIAALLRRSSSSSGWIITTLGFSIIIENVASKIWGSNPRPVATPPDAGLQVWALHGALISPYDIAVVLLTIAIVLALELLRRTRYGRAVEAVSEDRELARIRGVNPERLTMLAFILGGACAGIAGIVAAPLTLASTSLGPTLLVAGFEVAAVGGVGSNAGSLIAGYVLGLVQAATAAVLAPGYQSLVSYGVLVLALMIRPAGILGKYRARHV
jgi:branched-chain amino acid transport system permease protein